jgi:hypothetical protein
MGSAASLAHHDDSAALDRLTVHEDLVTGLDVILERFEAAFTFCVKFVLVLVHHGAALANSVGDVTRFRARL